MEIFKKIHGITELVLTSVARARLVHLEKSPFHNIVEVPAVFWNMVEDLYREINSTQATIQKNR